MKKLIATIKNQNNFAKNYSSELLKGSNSAINSFCVLTVYAEHAMLIHIFNYCFASIVKNNNI